MTYTSEYLKNDVENHIGIKAENIEKIELVGMWQIRFRAFGSDFYYYLDTEGETHLEEDPWIW